MEQWGIGAVLHTPVLVREVVEFLGCRPGGLYVDATVGLGGHAELILRASSPDGRLIGLDQDREAIGRARIRLAPFGERALLIEENFVNLRPSLEQRGIREADGILFDLGVSSAQLSTPERGFGFLVDGPLDMRMDVTQSRTAAELVNRLPEAELADILYEYGEERWSRRIARAMVRARPLARTTELAAVIASAVPGRHRHQRIHPATRTFQALRIAVNRELDVLPTALSQAAELLRPGGRLAVIAFHSLEDRIVKGLFRNFSGKGFRVLTKKPLRARPEEVEANPRSRSAKLRVMERATEGSA
jgi:16S rRNA (cytosine1402-N4)-methyltransferase